MNKLTYMLKFKPRELLVPTTLALMLTLGGCVSLEPTLPVAITGVASNWPLPATSAKLASATVPAEIGDSDTGVVADIGWRDFFTDPKLVEIIAHALDNNRDLRVAVLNVERARAQYDIQRAGQVPSIGVNGTMSRGGGLVATPGTVYSASVGLSSFELDLFGRVHNLSQAALQQYFAQEQARRAAQLSLIAEVARAYLTLASDLEAQRVAQATLDNQQAAFDLIVKRHRAGAVSGLDVSQAETTVESARVDRARYVGQVATDRNALVLLVGAPIEAALLPHGLLPAESGLLPLPPGLPSQVLLRRPDVLQAEYQLRSANASIG
ncbi:MAG: TolC family protein, partial [Herbaspirillum sp.]